MTLLEQLSQHLQRPVNEEVRQRARLHLLDWLACVAGARLASINQAAETLEMGDQLSLAALLGNVLEMDDVHRTALLHPGPVVWPSALFKSQWNWMSYDTLLESAVVGYEAMICVGSTFDAHHYQHYHPTATAGVFGSAATFFHRLNEKKNLPSVFLGWALGNAGSVSGGLWHMRHDKDAFTKQWHLLHAVMTGRTAAVLAVEGLRGPLALLEGPQGLYAATCREPKPMVLGDGWRIFEVSFKPWAACRHAHPAIDCALELRAAGKLAPPFHVETYADAIAFCDKPDPVTEVDAKFSLQHAVAVIADGRNATPADFTLEAIAALAELRSQVMVAEAPEITARYPAHFGARLNGFELVDCRGDPERPVSEADIIAKMHMLAAWGGLPPEEADRAVELALRGNDAAAITTMLEDWLS